jgi:hypothetical protein
MHFSDIIGEQVKYQGDYHNLLRVGITDVDFVNEILLLSGRVVDITTDLDFGWTFQLRFSFGLVYIPIEWCTHYGKTFSIDEANYHHNNNKKQLRDIIEL